MPPQPKVPEELLTGPFHQSRGLELGVSADMLSGASWERVYPRVWKHRDYLMTHADRLTAARLAMPSQAHLSHVSRLQALGLAIGPRSPIHFTIVGDHHIALSGIFLHRTKALGPTDEIGISPAGAFIQYCADARQIDALIAGDWLLARDLMSIAQLRELCSVHPWRPGARQAGEIAGRLTTRSRSASQTETRALLEACGLPQPDQSAVVEHNGRGFAVVDMLLAPWRVAIEFEARSHARGIGQLRGDIHRHARFRAAGFEYIQITEQMLSRPRALMLLIHRVLDRRGYSGPGPQFGTDWLGLFSPITVRGQLRALSYQAPATALLA